MLKELRLNNLAIIKNMEIDISDGLVTLTGETGAGKSIILDGISLLLGERSNSDIIRNEEESLLAEGIFELSLMQIEKLNNLGFEIIDNELIINRTFNRKGNSKIYVNGKRMNLSSLKSLMSNVLDLVGQHEHQYLLNPQYHLELLDKFLNLEGKETKEKIKKIVGNIRKINKEINNLEEQRNEIINKKDVLEFQLDEISSLNLVDGEDIELEKEYKMLFNSGKIIENLKNSMFYLKENDSSVIYLLKEIKKNISKIKDVSKDYENIFENLENISTELDDIYYVFNSELENVNIDDKRIEEVVNRIEKINKLKFKYANTISEILEYKEDISNKLSSISLENNELEKLKLEKQELQKEYNDLSINLRKIRKELSKKLEKEINKELKDLNMGNAIFKIKFISLDSITKDGIDNIEFMICSNKGEKEKELAKIASGGEVSRIMLALKIVFSKVDDISVLIFDEIDSGISGETVKKVALKLKELSQNVQVICVTHSPQIAAKSKQQFLIKKYIKDSKTETKIKELSKEERIKEIARIISGDEISKISIEHAKEMMVD